jgi:hypothetical protein
MAAFSDGVVAARRFLVMHLHDCKTINQLPLSPILKRSKHQWKIGYRRESPVRIHEDDYLHSLGSSFHAR